MKKIVSLISVFVFFTALGAGLLQARKSAQLEGVIEVAGSSTVYPITVALAEEFNRMHPRVDIAVRSTGTGGGFKNFFIHGLTDINDASRTIKSKEMSAARANGIVPLEFQVAIDAITIVVNPDSPVNGMTVEQLKKLWKPDAPAKRWSDLDPSWPAQTIELYGPTSASGTFDYFTEVIIGQSGSSRSDYQKTEQDNTIVQAVQGSPNALGYFGLAYYLENKDSIKALSVNGVMPALETARTGKYTPLSRPIFIYVNAKALKKPELREFVRFYLEQTSSSLISEIGYVPVTEAILKANLKKFDEAVAKYAR